VHQWHYGTLKKRLRRLRFKFGFAAGAIRNETSFQKTPHLWWMKQSINPGRLGRPGSLARPTYDHGWLVAAQVFEVKRVSPLIWLKSSGPAVCKVSTLNSNFLGQNTLQSKCWSST